MRLLDPSLRSLEARRSVPAVLEPTQIRLEMQSALVVKTIILTIAKGLFTLVMEKELRLVSNVRAMGIEAQVRAKLPLVVVNAKNYSLMIKMVNQRE